MHPNRTHRPGRGALRLAGALRLTDALRLAAALVLALAAAAGPARAIPLREAYEQAGPQGDYDKYVVLETGVTYTGGLLIGPTYGPLTWDLEGEPGCNVRIVGNGAILDLQGEQICMSYCNRRLDIDDCVVLNGNIRFRGLNDSFHQEMPIGSVRYVTFYRPHDYGVRLQGAGHDIVIERNLVVDAIDTGNDYIFTTGIASEWLPTGTNISASAQAGFYGTPVITANWSFHTDPARNATPIAHFSFLCEHG